MAFCMCITKPVVIAGACHVCKRQPAPHDHRNEIKEIIRPGMSFELPTVDELDLQAA